MDGTLHGQKNEIEESKISRRENRMDGWMDEKRKLHRNPTPDKISYSLM